MNDQDKKHDTIYYRIKKAPMLSSYGFRRWRLRHHLLNNYEADLMQTKQQKCLFIERNKRVHRAKLEQGSRPARAYEPVYLSKTLIRDS